MVTKEQAVDLGQKHGSLLKTVTIRNSKGGPLYCRVNGKCKTWKTRPEEFSLPVKYGLYTYFYIGHHNAADWEVA